MIAAQGDLQDPDESLASITDESVWINESFEAAQAVAYAEPISTDDTPSSLTDTYKRDALNKAKERIALAGARLERLLEAALK